MTAKKNILVVDDDRDLVASIEVYLGARGYAVQTAGNGTEALEAIGRCRPDLAILDVMMDYDAEGFTLAYKLQDAPETHDIPIIILSGFTQHLDTKAAAFEPIMGREWPAAKFFQKPVELRELAETVAALTAGDIAPQV
jgi:DNA-binding response OmpR family regulator